jgi:SAM-dependent methyltransferase
MAARRFELSAESLVVEVASNDGCLLQNFIAAGIPAYGIDPAAECAREAERQYGVETVVAFFGQETAEALRESRGPADLIVANNVLAHVPDMNDFVAGFASLLKPEGVAIFEFPHLLEMIARCEFDTIYHEHYSYLSLLAVEPLFARHGLAIFDVEKLPTHGHSLRVFVAPAAAGMVRSQAVDRAIDEECSAGLGRTETYSRFARQAAATREALRSLLIGLKAEGKTIAACGAPAKATTLLNYCGIGGDIIGFTVDRNPRKQGRVVPGTGIPVSDPGRIHSARPDVVVILPWNIADELMAEFAAIRDWGGRFLVPIPLPRLA